MGIKDRLAQCWELDVQDESKGHYAKDNAAFYGFIWCEYELIGAVESRTHWKILSYSD